MFKRGPWVPPMAANHGHAGVACGRAARASLAEVQAAECRGVGGWAPQVRASRPVLSEGDRNHPDCWLGSRNATACARLGARVARTKDGAQRRGRARDWSTGASSPQGLFGALRATGPSSMMDGPPAAGGPSIVLACQSRSQRVNL